MSTGAFRRVMKLAAIALTAASWSCDRAPDAPRTHTVIIDKMTFGPVPKNVRAGDVILWVNNDIFQHTATARDRSFNIDLAPAARGKTVVQRSGTLAFYCTYHPGMTGRIVVAGK